jgi:hypothetical protein
VIVRSGITRTVLLVGRYAIKFPTLRGGSARKHSRLRFFCHGVLANLSELEWHEYFGDAVAPVLWSMGGLVNVYPRCEPFVSFEDDPAGRALDDVPSVIDDVRIGDLKHDNLGYLNGRAVWIDYDMQGV